MFKDYFDIFTVIEKDTHHVHYDDGTRNVALTRPTVKKLNAITAMNIIFESNQSELEATFWPGFNSVHLYVHTNKPVPPAVTN